MIKKLYLSARKKTIDFKNDERGVTAIEYGLIGIAMAVLLSAAFAADGTLVQSLTDAFALIGTTISGFAPTP